ncbi:EsaB/YukD family protein [Micromonospora sp. NPDC049366]|uniref:EsaB/YukD family protein n=1 Tax=Micromonospora sp. NPDC049366 TaxID=3364271 RepID=UPI00378FFD59
MSRPGSTEAQPRCLVTVVGARKRVDLAVPADAPIAEYADLLARLVGQESDEALPPAWTLAPLGAPPLPLTSSLSSAGVVDGAVLYLRDVLDGEADEPVVRSVWEVVSELGKAGRGSRWDLPAKGRSAILLGAAWLLFALGYLTIADRGRVLVGVSAATIGVGFAVAARLLRPYPRVLPGGLRTLLGCAVIPCMALVAILSLGPVRWDVPHLVYGQVGVTLGLLIALVAVPGVLLAAVTLLVVVTGSMTTIALALGASPAATAATAAAAGTLFLAVAPRVAGLLTAASWLRMSSPTVEPAADADKLGARVAQARHTLVLLMSTTSAIVAVALLVLTRDTSAFSLVLAAVATVALLVRAGTFEFATEAIGPVVAGTAGTFGLIGALGHWSATRPLVLPLMLLAGVAAVCAGLPVVLWRSGVSGADLGRERQPPRFGALLTTCQVVLPALLLGVYGVYGLLWGLGRSF